MTQQGTAMGRQQTLVTGYERSLPYSWTQVSEATLPEAIPVGRHTWDGGFGNRRCTQRFASIHRWAGLRHRQWGDLLCGRRKRWPRLREWGARQWEHPNRGLFLNILTRLMIVVAIAVTIIYQGWDARRAHCGCVIATRREAREKGDEATLLGHLHVFVSWLWSLAPRSPQAQQRAWFDWLGSRRRQGSCCSDGPTWLGMDTCKRCTKVLRLCGTIDIIGHCCICNKKSSVHYQTWADKVKHLRGKTAEDGKEEAGDIEDADTAREGNAVCDNERGSPSTETDAVSEKYIRSTSGDEGRATFSGRQAVAKVALAVDAGKLPQGVVMHVSREYVHEKLERVGEGKAESLSFCGGWRRTSWSW